MKEASVALFIANRAECQRRKFSSKQPATLPLHLELGGVGETLAIDHFGPFVIDKANTPNAGSLSLLTCFPNSS